MRITIVTGPFYPAPPGPCGAVERLWHGLATEMAAKGHHVTLLSRSFPGAVADERHDHVDSAGSPSSKSSSGSLRIIRRTQFRHTRKLPKDLLKDMLYSLRMLMLLPRADVVVTNVFWLPALIPWLRRRAGKVMVHVQRFPKNQMWLYQHADSITTVSQVIADAMIEQSPRVKKLVKIVPNPIRTEVFVASGSKQHRKNDDGQTIIYTGRVHPEKGLHLLVEAFKKLQVRHPKLRLRIVGPSAIASGGGGDEYVNELKSIAGAAKVDIEFVPPIYDENALADALRAADFYCYPTVAAKGEASPVAPLEAMAVGLVPVVSDIAQFKGYIIPGETGCVFDYLSPDAASLLAAELDALITQPDRTARMKQKGMEKAQEFSYSRIADLYLEEFEKMVRPRV